MIFKIDTTSTADKVFQQMKWNILNDVWHRGMKIRSEIELAQQFGVSRNTVRAATQRLIVMGLIYVKRGDGTVVTDSIFNENLVNTIPYIDMDEMEWYELLKFRSKVEVSMMQLACVNRTEEELAHLKKYAEDIVALRQDNQREQSTYADLQFHICLAASTRNRTYYSIVLKMKDIWFNQQRMSRLKFTEEYYDLHTDVYEAVRQQNVELAQSAMKAHLEYRLDEIKNNLISTSD